VSADNPFSVSGRVIVVTGAGRGNGRAIAVGLARLGATVFGIDLEFTDGEDAFAKIPCDATDESATNAALRTILEGAGQLDGLVNNAAVNHTATEPYGRAAFERAITTNTWAPLRLSHAAAEAMKQGGRGSIVNITSLGAHLGFPDNPAYQASKAALGQITRAMAVDYGRFGIRINNLCPGYIVTPMTQRSYEDDERREARSRRMILNRWGKPEDLIGPCAFLLSDAASYVTGIDLTVDGGWMARGL
jgi:NAD(P)-dependent dehydrogenase (short-subunit alcohol dehydrogenase family)